MKTMIGREWLWDWMRVSVCEKVSVHMLLLLELERDVECSHYFDCFLSFLGLFFLCCLHPIKHPAIEIVQITFYPPQVSLSQIRPGSLGRLPYGPWGPWFLYWVVFSAVCNIKFILNLNIHILPSSSSQVYLSFLIELITFYYSQG